MRRLIPVVAIVWVSLWVPIRADRIVLVQNDLRYNGETVVANDAIIVSKEETDGRIWKVTFYYWDSAMGLLKLKGQEVPSPTAELKVTYSAPEERDRIIGSFRDKGIHARITDINGSKLDYFCLKAGYELPGLNAFGKFPEEDTLVRLDAESVPFTEISTITFTKDTAEVILTNGKLVRGRWLGPQANVLGDSEKERRYSVRLRGIDRSAKHLDVWLSSVYKIELVRNRQ